MLVEMRRQEMQIQDIEGASPDKKEDQIQDMVGALPLKPRGENAYCIAHQPPPGRLSRAKELM